MTFLVKEKMSNWSLTKSDIGGVWYFPSAANFSDDLCALILLSGVAAFFSLSSFVDFGLSSFFLKSEKK